ncbi:hypothetical protein [Blastococcus sp. SYSU D00813]
MSRRSLNLAEAQVLAARFLAERKARHGDLRMEAGDDGADGGQDNGDDQQDGQDDDGAGQLGDAGKQALDRMKTQRNQFRDELRPWQSLGVTPDQVRELLGKQGAGDGQPDPDEIRRQAKAEARAEVLRDRVVDRIEAKAAKDFADPEDAVAILLRTRKADDFLNGDSIDVEKIEDALKALLKNKPHLAAQGRRFQGDADGGARKETAKPEPAPGLGRLRAAYADSK